MHCGPATFLLRMAGASASPRFEDGGWLWLDPDEPAEPAEPARFVAGEDPAGGCRTARLMAESEGRRVLLGLDGTGPGIVPRRGNGTMILGTVAFAGSGI